MGHGGADCVRYRVGGQQRAFLMTTGTQTTLATGEGDEHLVAAIAAADAGKTEVEIPTTEELACHLPNNRPPPAVALLVTIIVGAFKLRQAALDELVER